MEAGQILVGLFYLWLLVALGIYAWRAYRRIVHRETRTQRSTRDADTGAGAAGREPAATAPAAAPAPASGGPGPGARPTLAELVQGIALPCELVPLLAGGEPDPHRAVFVTTGHGAGDVTTAVGEELARLGFSVEAVGAGEAVATREGARLRVRVHPDGPVARSLFPEAPAHSVVAELTT